MPLSKRPALSLVSTVLRTTAPRSSPRAYQLYACTTIVATSSTHAPPFSAQPWLSTPDVRSFHQTALRRGIMPDAEVPAPKESQPNEQATAPTDISIEEYHQHADKYLDALVQKVEEMQETRQDIELDYSQGVLTIEFAGKGTYVINKQPPNKQIWLSSPIAGPKRYDWVVLGESMNQKEGAGRGEWIYLRDNSTLTELIKDEIGVNLGVDEDVPV